MRFVALFIITLCFVPTFSHALTVAEVQAQIDALLAQVAALQKGSAPALSAGAACPALSRNLSRGVSGSDVTALQIFLKAEGHLNADATGFFGALTEKALQDFQSKHRIVTSGSAQTTGFGAVGPKTRAAIAARCATSPTPPSTPQQCPVLGTAPTAACAGAWQVLDVNGCRAWRCVVAQTPNNSNKSPVLETVNGPTTVYVNTPGSWSVVASDPENGSLEYSVIWGDEGSQSILEQLAGISSPRFSTSALLSHTFVQVGTYTPSVTVRDAAGNSVQGVFSVTVTTRPASSTPIVSTPTPGSCAYGGTNYPPNTETEGYTGSDLCLETGGVCPQRDSYIPKFKCENGEWKPLAKNPYPNMPTYGNIVGTKCGSGSLQVVVTPGSQLCRGLLCATAQSYTPITLACQYTYWVDWGVFYASATTTKVCGVAAPCEYGFGAGGRACAGKQNGSCPVPSSGHPLDP